MRVFHCMAKLKGEIELRMPKFNMEASWNYFFCRGTFHKLKIANF
jgi:hypothetical protein